MIPDMTTGMRHLGFLSASLLRVSLVPVPVHAHLHDEVRSEGCDAGNADARLSRAIGGADACERKRHVSCRL